MFFNTQRFVRIMLLHLGAIAIAAAVAVAMPFVAGASTLGIYGGVSASIHCTNYFPTSYTPDTNCDNSGGGTNGTMPAGSWGQTGSIAPRDSNCMYTTANRSLEVWYGENSPATGFGTALCIGASSGSERSGCKNIDTSSATGRCVTLWHN
jgi:hypothetical protein